MNVEILVRFNFQIPDGTEVRPDLLFIDLPVDSVTLYNDQPGLKRGTPIPPIPAKLIQFETTEGYCI